MLAYDALFGKLKFRFVLETSQICACGLDTLHDPADALRPQAGQ